MWRLQGGTRDRGAEAAPPDPRNEHHRRVRPTGNRPCSNSGKRTQKKGECRHSKYAIFIWPQNDLVRRSRRECFFLWPQP